MLDTESIPKYVAIIMDGNGIWARQNKLSILRGHNAGMLRVKEVVKESDRLGVKGLFRNRCKERYPPLFHVPPENG